jgi:beta-lactamase class A
VSLADDVTELCAGFSGVAGVSARNLSTGEEVSLRENEAFPTASAIKPFVLLALLRAAELGEVDLAERIAIDRSHHVLGSGALSHLDAGLSPTLMDLGVLMLMLSDNTATNLLLNRLSVDAINAAIARVGLQHTTLRGKIDFAEDPSAFASSTPADLSAFYRSLTRGELLDASHTARLLDVLRIQKYIEPLRRELPADPYAREFGDDEPVWVASKTGSLSGVRVDAGLIHTPRAEWSLAVMTKTGADRRVTSDNEGVVLIARVSRVIYDAWS